MKSIKNRQRREYTSVGVRPYRDGSSGNSAVISSLLLLIGQLRPGVAYPARPQGQNRSAEKLFVWNRNNWYPIIMYKSFV